MVLTATPRTFKPQPVLEHLAGLLQGRLPELQVFMESSGGERALAARAFFLTRAIDDLAALKLMESVAHLLLDCHEKAFTAAHDAWTTVAGRSNGHLQALVLTQLAATAARRGDGRGAVRAVRRAEALIVAEAGEDTPQALAVRAQLVALQAARGEDITAAETRRQRSFDLMQQTMAAQPARVQRYADTFSGNQPPSWALCYCLRWRF
ncbi:MAG: hypothetical protein EXS14_07610 [Planctomycetes bacterium]|nr:hypothetical protein [Planctomycetota bacterium]